MAKISLRRDSILLAPLANKLFIISPKASKAFGFFLPHYFHYFCGNRQLVFLFANKFFYSSFLAHLFSMLRHYWMIYVLKLRLRGLGYRIRRYGSFLYRFYFTRTNYIYFHLPKHLIIKRRKKKILLLSTNYHLVRLVFTNLMFLYKIGPYNRRGFVYPRQIIFLKPIKKIV